MSEAKSFASLTPRLLARKGGAKPAMRPALASVAQFGDALARAADDDLGWNDMGHEGEDLAEAGGAEIVAIGQPVVVRQRAELARRIAEPTERRSALADGRRAAFTLRVDADRHLKLRLACTMRGRSAQQLVTDALDRLLGDMPELDELAARVARTKPGRKH